MSEMILTIAALVTYLLVFYYLYIAIMGVYRAHLSGRLRGVTFVLCVPLLIIGYAVDIIGNLLATFVFLDMPQEILVTTRLQRYKKTETGWRLTTAEMICEGLLDLFDPRGDHC